MKKKLFKYVGGALLLAVASGWGGYELGLRHSARGESFAEKDRVAADSKATRDSRFDSFDPAVVKREIDAEKSQLKRFKIAQDNLERWVAKDPVGALDWLASQPTSYRKRELIRLALNQFSETDGREAAKWAIGNLQGGELNNSLIAIANEWASQNGREAASWFLSLPDTRERDAAVENMMFVWATNEPNAAIGFVEERGGDLADFASTLRRASLAGWAKSDPEGAVSASLEISKKENDPGQFANTLANWATIDLENSSEWLIQNIEKGEVRTAAAAELGAIFAQQSPLEGVEFLKKFEAGEERDFIGNVFAEEWAAFGVEDAAKWAAEQNAISLGEVAASEISMNFLQEDPAGFDKWRASLPPGSLKEAADLVVQTPEEE